MRAEQGAVEVAKVGPSRSFLPQYGIIASVPVTDMDKVCDYLYAAIQQIYQPTTPEAMRRKGMNVYLGPTPLPRGSSIQTGENTIQSSTFWLRPERGPPFPPLTVWRGVSYVTYEHIFENRRLPQL